MKKTKKFVALLLTVIMLFSTMAISVSADENGKFVQLTVKTDKAEYSATETATVTVTVRNKSGQNLKNVAVGVKAESWLIAKDGGSNVQDVGELIKDGENVYQFRTVVNRKAEGIGFFQKIILFFKQLFSKPSDFKAVTIGNRRSAEVKTSVKHGGATINITAIVCYDAPSSDNNNPSNPSNPNNPSNPDTPSNPDNPSNPDKPAEPEKVKVTFDTKGNGDTPPVQLDEKGGKITVPEAPKADGYLFLGWFKDSECTIPWDFDKDTVTSDITLYAKWESHTTHTFGTEWKSDDTYHWHECSCGEKESDSVKEHDFGEPVVKTEPTYTAEGSAEYTCNTCKKVIVKSLPALEIKPVTEGGREYVYFGSYPQSEPEYLKNVSKNATLRNKMKKAADEKGWTSYGYCLGLTGLKEIPGSPPSYQPDGDEKVYGMAPSDFMKYCDLEYDADGDGTLEKYRGVQFSKFRPRSTTFDGFGYDVLTSSSEPYNVQYANGYHINIIYWFKFEPIKWRILDEKEGLVMSELLIDSQPFNEMVIKYGKDGTAFNRNAYYNSDEHEYFTADWGHSSLKAFLEGLFWDTAFDETEKSVIETRQNNNENIEHLKGNYSYDCYNRDPSDDKVFILSYDEVTDPAYGFKHGYDESNKPVVDDARIAEGTDYAKCQGLETKGDGKSYWNLRTPGSNNYVIVSVSDKGQVTPVSYTENTFRGIRPVIVLAPLKTAG